MFDLYLEDDEMDQLEKKSRVVKPEQAITWAHSRGNVYKVRF